MSSREQLQKELAGLQNRMLEIERQLEGRQARSCPTDVLPESSILFQQFANAIPYIIRMTAPDGKTIFVNPAFQQIFGRQCEELYQRPTCWLESVHPDDRERVSKLVAESRHRQCEKQFRIVRPDGDLRVIRDLSVPIRDDQETVYMHVGIAEDVTEQEHARGKIQQQQAQLAHVMRLSTMGEMAAGIAHEINQPLSAVSNYTAASVNMLRRNESPRMETVFDWLGRAGAEARRAGEIIRRMRTFVKRVEPSRTACYLEPLIREGVELALATGLKLETRITMEFSDRPSRVDCDVVQIQQVLVNLLRNACEAMHHLPVGEREIVVRTQKNESEALVSVNDVAGASDIDDEVFEPFYTTKKNGMGMGLAICRSIVEAHCGRLWAVPNGVHGGSSFCFTIPESPVRGQT